MSRLISVLQRCQSNTDPKATQFTEMSSTFRLVACCMGNARNAYGAAYFTFKAQCLDLIKKEITFGWVDKFMLGMPNKNNKIPLRFDIALINILPILSQISYNEASC